MNQRIVCCRKHLLGWLAVWGALWCLTGGLIGCSPDGRSCQDHNDCGPGYTCNSVKKCIPGCQLSVECPIGQGCRGNQCLAVTEDKDEDGFLEPIDCNDNDALINPGVSEVCNNKIDDNCNGQIDEEGCVNIDCRPGDTRECYDGKDSTLAEGRRCRKGRQTCTSSGQWGECQGQVLPVSERCDGEDNDCDGKTDEDDKDGTLTRSCYSGSSVTTGVGLCKEGKQTCKDGKWGECVGEVVPVKEECNEKDDDCDGQVDNVERVGEACDTQKQGECAKGRMACDTKQKKLVCTQTVESKEEICDGKDNNCDGVIDDGCPYVPQKVTQLSGFPHAVALSASWAAVSLRDTKKVAIFDISGKEPKATQEVTLPEAPYGIKVVSDVAYTVTAETIQKIDLVLNKAEQVVKVSNPSHAAQLEENGGILYTRAWMKDTQNQTLTFAFCRTDPSIPKIDCNSPQGTFARAGYGVALWPSSSSGLIMSDLGVHFFDMATLQADPKPLPITADIQDIAVDPNKSIATVVDANFRKIFLINLLTRTQIAALDAVDKDNNPTVPNHVVSADGYSYVTLKSNQVAVIDLSQNKIVQWVSVGVAPLGLGIGPRDGAKGRSVWVTCPGDNTIWRFQVP